MSAGMAASGVGFFGKIPARGDFVRAGLPPRLVAAWDGWVSAVLPASRAALGDGWEPAWMVAPVWRFALPAGACGPDPVLGVWMPSVDSAGRCFPLLLAAWGGAGASEVTAGHDGWLDAAEAAGRAALAEDLAPADLLARLPAAAGVAGDGAWWTHGSPLVPAARFALPGLPDARRFVAMLDAGWGAGT